MSSRDKEVCQTCKGKGEIFLGSGKKEQCPDCLHEKQVTATRGITPGGRLLAEVLGFEGTQEDLGLFKSNFNFNKIFPKNERGLIEDLKEYQQRCEDIYYALGGGTIPSESYCIGLGVKGNTSELAYSLLVNAYVGGLKISQVITPHKIQRASSMVRDDADFSLQDSLYDSDVAVCILPEGSFKNEILSIKSLMQVRAVRRKPTIIITTWSPAACSTFLDTGGRFDMATAIFPTYKKKVVEEGIDGVVGAEYSGSSYLDGITGVSNSQGGGTSASRSSKKKSSFNINSLSSLKG